MVMLEDRRARFLVLQAGLKGAILRRIVDDQHLDIAGAQLRGDAVEHALDRLLRVVRDDEDEEALLAEVHG